MRSIVSLDVAQAMIMEREGRARSMLKENPGLFQRDPTGTAWLCAGGIRTYKVTDSCCDCPDYKIWADRIPNFRCKHMIALGWIQEKSEQQEEKENNNNMDETTTTTGWVKLYHPAGVQCTIPLPLNGTLTESTSLLLLEEVSALIGAGWLVNQPSLEEGETREAVSYVARRQANDTDVIDVYCGGQYKTLHVYMNDAEDYEDFEKSFGMRVGAIPLWDGDTPIKRGERPDRDAKYLVNVGAAEVEVVWRLNPRYEGEGDKKHQKRSFVRWERRGRPSPSEVVKANLNAQNAQEESLRYGDGTRLDEGNENEVKAFNLFLKSQGRCPESRNALREWFKTQQTQI